MKEAEVPGLAVVVVHADDPPVAQGFGLRRLGRPEPVDADTVFNIASLTKSFTAASAAIMVDEGRLSWGDRAARWLPQLEFGDPWLTEHVTLADLLSHRTGLQAANTAWYFSELKRPEMLRRVRYLEAAAPFRTEQVYNNVLYTVAGEVIGAAAGKTWEELVRTRLFRPLGMKSSKVGMLPTESGNFAAPHAVVNGRQQPVRPAPYMSTAPAGGIDSTARDMVHWLQFQLGDGTFQGRRVIAAKSMQAMHEPWAMIPTTPEMRAARQVQFFAGYGLGWNVMDYRGRKLLWHSGNAKGMPSYMALLPEQRIGVVVMVNSWIAPLLHGDIASRIFDHYLGLPTRDYAAETLKRTREAEARTAAAGSEGAAAGLPPLELAAYEGTYRSDLYGQIVVSRGATGLALRLDEGEAADLLPLNRDSFTVRWQDRALDYADTRVSFALDEAGKVTRLSMKVRRDQIEAKR
jgi:CubicO group peptidase (beta-lactamase class C family)